MFTIMYVPCDVQLYIQEKEAFINNVLDKQAMHPLIQWDFM